MATTLCLLFPFIINIHIIGSSEVKYHDHIIIGAGPSGLQMGYLMQHFDKNKEFDYLIIERNDKGINWFSHYPRHGKLLSINKVFTGNGHKEFNLRHDWNSLLTPKKAKNKFLNNLNAEHYKMRFANYSEQYYPDRRELSKYLSDFPVYFDLNILYNAEVTFVDQDLLNDGLFFLDVSIYSKPQNSNKEFNECTITRVRYSCKYLFVATGLSKTNTPPIVGIKKATSYSKMSTDVNFYKNKTIAVLGGKNSAFEVAQFVSKVSAFTHIFPILMPRFSYETHYVGDVRAKNMEFLDHYLLKSLDGITEQTILQMQIFYDEDTKKYTLQHEDFEEIKAEMKRPWPFRCEYDDVIYAAGFLFDCDIFSEELCAKLLPNPRKVRYPAITNKYQARRVSNLYVLGGLMHSVDWKKTAGGFIHGYRYLVKAVFHQSVEQNDYENTKIVIQNDEIAKYLMIRVNTASSYYQMFAVMCDIVIIRSDGSAEYYFDMLMSQLNTLSSIDCMSVIVMTFDYHPDFFGHDTVLYDKDRVIQDYRKAKDSKFLHPVLRYYSCKILNVKNDNSFKDYTKSKYKISERHIIEDFLTLWDDEKYHFEWLASWIKRITKIEQIKWEYNVADLMNAYD